MSFQITVPADSVGNPFVLSLEEGASAIFVGANGSGKTRLAVFIENLLSLRAHRISAHRALSLNPTVVKTDENTARRGLKTGWTDARTSVSQRAGNRWQQKEAVSLLNDFDFLLQILFAEQTNSSLVTHKNNRKGNNTLADPTKFEKLTEIWERLLPHRKLHITGDSIEVHLPGSTSNYSASDMSDGERAIFYMIGQTLVADPNSVLIIDEPELHVHRAIMGKLWDELEASRTDCAFVFITHDLEFAASRVAQKFVIRGYIPTPAWVVEPVPEDTGFDEETTTRILGSRKPILFAEGRENSLDTAIYRCCYPEWTVISRGSCQEVIHSVVTMRKNSSLTRVTCSGIVDADGNDSEDSAYLNTLGVLMLPVSEIENIIMLPSVSRVIAEIEGYKADELEAKLVELREAIFNSLTEKNVEAAVLRHCRRHIDRSIKKIDLSAAESVEQITAEYQQQTTSIDVPALAEVFREKIRVATQDKNLPALLENYDNKGLIALAAAHLKSARKLDFEAWLLRALKSEKHPNLIAAVQTYLPSVVAS